jgi:adenine phosphoribosyltransferase
MSAAAPQPDARRAAIRAAIRVIPDFPKPGIMFQDVSTLLLDPAAFQASIDILVERYSTQNIDAVAGFEARGFVFGPPVALALKVPFVMLRKPKKLPGEVVGEEYVTEYSTDRIEVHTGAIQPGQRVLLIDDLVATGGTLLAGASLVRKVGGAPVEAAAVIELPFLQGRAKLGDLPLFTIIDVEGE